MAAALDPGILEDFLAEAGELADGLSRQLLALESAPEDADLLNAVFRAFHTLKGGAGFLNQGPMVTLCHRAEDLLNAARNRRLLLGSAHLDVLLESLDLVQGMLRALRNGEMLQEAPRTLLVRLETLLQEGGAKPSSAPPSVASDTAAAGLTPSPLRVIDPIEAEFEAMLDAAAAAQKPDGKVTAVLTTNPAASSDDRTLPMDDSEFEALLDHIYGAGGAPGVAHVDVSATEESTRLQSGHAALAPSPFTARADTAPAPAVATPTAVSIVGMAPQIAALSTPPTTETALVPAPAQAAPVVEASVRVDVKRLDALVDSIGELVLVRNRLLNLGRSEAGTPLERALGDLDRVARDLQNAVMRTRMQPVARLFQRFPRIVRDLARQLDKEVELRLSGEDTDLDRSLVEALSDPMVHLVRNALDHGLETPAERRAAGKSEVGHLHLSAAQQGERIVISIGEDGRGMDAEVLRSKATQKGLVSAERAARLSEAECYELIFLPGFSTRSEISSISGRGVGMDVVRTRVAELGGAISLRSEHGRGTEIRLTLPLTLAIVRVLLVDVGTQLLALPLASVLEVFELTPGLMQQVDGRPVAAHRGRPLPLLWLQDWLRPGTPHPSREHVVVIESGHVRVGLVVRAVRGRQEVVTKPLGLLFPRQAALSGATITGDGNIALLLDLAGYLRAQSFEHGG